MTKKIEQSNAKNEYVGIPEYDYILNEILNDVAGVKGIRPYIGLGVNLIRQNQLPPAPERRIARQEDIGLRSLNQPIQQKIVYTQNIRPEDRLDYLNRANILYPTM